MPETPRTLSASLAFAGCIDRLNASIGRSAAWLCLLVVLVQFAVVLMRYLFGMGSIWLTETIIYGHAALFMLASAWTLREGGHVRVDIFYADAGPRWRALVDFCGALFLLLPFMAVLAWFAFPYVARSWAILETSRETSGLPWVYLLKTLIPAFAVLMGLQGVAQAIRAWSVLQAPPVTPGLDPGVHSTSQDGLPGHRRAKRRRSSNGYARE